MLGALLHFAAAVTRGGQLSGRAQEASTVVLSNKRVSRNADIARSRDTLLPRPRGREVGRTKPAQRIQPNATWGIGRIQTGGQIHPMRPQKAGNAERTPAGAGAQEGAGEGPPHATPRPTAQAAECRRTASAPWRGGHEQPPTACRAAQVHIKRVPEFGVRAVVQSQLLDVGTPSKRARYPPSDPAPSAAAAPAAAPAAAAAARPPTRLAASMTPCAN